MAGVCTPESDPSKIVSKFVSDKAVKNISGNRMDGLDNLMDLIRSEVVRQDGETKVITVDRDFMTQYKVLTAAELGACLIDLTFGEKCAIFLTESLPVIKWPEALGYLDKELCQVYYGSLSCGQVPLCVKLL